MAEEMEQFRWAEIEPIEYQIRKEKGRNPRIIRYRNLSFSLHLTQEIMNRIIKATKMKKNAVALNSGDQFVIYQYEGKPPVILDLLNQRVSTTKKALRQFGMRVCQQQASIVMRLLKKHGYAKFRRISVTVNTYRIGKNREDRKLTYKAIEDLLKVIEA